LSKIFSPFSTILLTDEGLSDRASARNQIGVGQRIIAKIQAHNIKKYTKIELRSPISPPKIGALRKNVSFFGTDYADGTD